MTYVCFFFILTPGSTLFGVRVWVVANCEPNLGESEYPAQLDPLYEWIWKRPRKKHANDKRGVQLVCHCLRFRWTMWAFSTWTSDSTQICPYRVNFPCVESSIQVEGSQNEFLNMVCSSHRGANSFTHRRNLRNQPTGVTVSYHTCYYHMSPPQRVRDWLRTC